MVAVARREIVDRSQPGIYHCSSRCVRRAFLCGKDKYSKKDYEHRRDWIEERVQELARWFGIDVVFFAILQNHLHLVLKTLPQLVAKWSDKQIIKRACKIFPCKFAKLGVANGEPTPDQLRRFVKDRPLVKELRSRLSDVSWFNRQLKQRIATQANIEDDCRGHFFEARFGCKRILDKTGILICGVYVDLNQIHACEATTPEESTRTSAYRRIKARIARQRKSGRAAEWDGFLCPIHIGGDGQDEGYRRAGTLNSQRASDRGVLDMSLEHYLQLLDWMGRQARRDKRGKIPDDAPPILQRLGLSGPSLVAFVEDFDDLFKHAVGRAEKIRQFAAQRGRRWAKGAKAVSQLETN